MTHQTTILTACGFAERLSTAQEVLNRYETGSLLCYTVLSRESQVETLIQADDSYLLIR